MFKQIAGLIVDSGYRGNGIGELFLITLNANGLPSIAAASSF
ncbi:hypothetical protein [Brevibacillus nitrificans]|nr:hypothetical protein [Brevibacillus nitrificans]